MSLEGRMPSPLYNRNKNVLIIGGSGAGKTRFYAKPNLMQLNCSYVFTDTYSIMKRLLELYRNAIGFRNSITGGANAILQAEGKEEVRQWYLIWFI